MTVSQATLPAARSVHRALIQWLLRLIQSAPDPFLTLGSAEAVAPTPDAPEAIEFELLGRRYRIVVEEVG